MSKEAMREVKLAASESGSSSSQIRPHMGSGFRRPRKSPGIGSPKGLSSVLKPEASAFGTKSSNPVFRPIPLTSTQKEPPRADAAPASLPSHFRLTTYRAIFVNPDLFHRTLEVERARCMPAYGTFPQPGEFPSYRQAYLSAPPSRVSRGSRHPPSTPSKELFEDGSEGRSDSDGEDSDSLSSLSQPRVKRAVGTSAYKKRNVYKSIIRHMFGYMRKHRDDISQVLKDAGYESKDIEHAFYKINYYNDMERQKGNPKRSQSIVKKFARKHCIYTYLLRETLQHMVQVWEQGYMGKVSSANREIYRDVCDKYLREVNRMISGGVKA